MYTLADFVQFRPKMTPLTKIVSSGQSPLSAEVISAFSENNPCQNQLLWFCPKLFSQSLNQINICAEQQKCKDCKLYVEETEKASARNKGETGPEADN